MMIKTVRMGIPILVSRSGLTAWSVELARNAGVSLIDRARSMRFLAPACPKRVTFDQSQHSVAEESARHNCQWSDDDG